MAHARSSVRRSPRNQKSPESKDAKALPLLSADICVNYDICLKHGTRNCGVCAKEKSPETTMIPKRQVITPTFRPAPFYSNSGCAFKRPLRYIKYKSPIIEYDCADRDYQFVDLLNQEIRDLSNNVPSLKYRELERVIDCLENLAFCGGEFFEAIQEMRNKKTKHNRCCICVSTRNEELLQCSKCSIFVHLSCYRSSDICADDEWLCDWCQFSNGFALHETPSSPKCVLCSHTGGAMKRTDHYELWCHVVCFENHPSTSFDELSLLVTGAETTPLPSYFTHCSICETLSGSPIQCMEDSCTTPIHLYCSHQQIQQLFSSGLCEDSPFNQLFLTCTKHTWVSLLMIHIMIANFMHSQNGCKLDYLLVLQFLVMIKWK
uniref:PHD-type domain-containing protein n=1 Tax=Vannella robusta TaxID=1487602 RepID=A0A6U1Y0Z8_9EUKA